MNAVEMQKYFGNQPNTLPSKVVSWVGNTSESSGLSGKTIFILQPDNEEYTMCSEELDFVGWDEFETE
jgi:hypothetical protein